MNLEVPCPAPPGPAARPHRFRNVQVLLGVFIVGQLLFLMVNSWLQLFSDLADVVDTDEAREVLGEFGPVNLNKTGGHLLDVLRVCQRWGQVTGQDQTWCLFAPNIGNDSNFLEVELRWDDPSPSAGARPNRPPYPPVRLKTDNLPADVNHFLRVGDFRMRKYESNMNLRFDIRPRPGDTPAQAVQRLRSQIARKVRGPDDAEPYPRWRANAKLLIYLNWRWKKYQRQQPDRPTPTQVILWLRQYEIPPPEPGPWRGWIGPDLVPVGRWQPGRPANDGYLPVEVYNPVTKRFEMVSR